MLGNLLYKMAFAAGVAVLFVAAVIDHNETVDEINERNRKAA